MMMMMMIMMVMVNISTMSCFVAFYLTVKGESSGQTLSLSTDMLSCLFSVDETFVWFMNSFNFLFFFIFFWCSFRLHCSFISSLLPRGLITAQLFLLPRAGDEQYTHWSSPPLPASSLLPLPPESSTLVWGHSWTGYLLAQSVDCFCFISVFVFFSQKSWSNSSSSWHDTSDTSGQCWVYLSLCLCLSPALCHTVVLSYRPGCHTTRPHMTRLYIETR